MQDIGNRIEAWLAANVPTQRDKLHPGASEQEIADTEAVLGVTFPDNIRASYRIHNGADIYGLFDNDEFFTLTAMRENWSGNKQLLDEGMFNDFPMMINDEKIQPGWWHPAWIPLAWNGCGDLVCLDLYPSSAGYYGQTIRWAHDGGPYFIARSFREWLEQIATDLEAGQYIFDAEHNRFYDRDFGNPAEE